MEKKRKAEIAKIEAKKNQAIKDLTGKHANKYTAIKEYYQEIINTNLDIIKQLKDDLAEAKKEDQTAQKDKMQQQEKNAQVVTPLQEANAQVKELEKKN